MPGTLAGSIYKVEGEDIAFKEHEDLSSGKKEVESEEITEEVEKIKLRDAKEWFENNNTTGYVGNIYLCKKKTYHIHPHPA